MKRKQSKKRPLAGEGGDRGEREHSAPATVTPPASKVHHPSQAQGPRVSLRPPSSSTMFSVAIFEGSQLKSPSIPIC
eukprot:1160630-Pelagomonas_calceolata.AAC.8